MYVHEITQSIQMTLSYVWLDASDIKTSELSNVQKMFQSTINKNLKLFDDEFECEGYVRSLPLTTKTVYIVDDLSAEEVIRRVQNLCQVIYIFVYHTNDHPNEIFSVYNVAKVKSA
jgi:hypothetical protein